MALAGAAFFFVGNFSIIYVTTLHQMVIAFSIQGKNTWGGWDVLVLSALIGLGFGLLLPSAFASFNQYFETRRTMAMSITQVLVMGAQIVCPGLTRVLMDCYGFRGTIAIYAALSLHCVPAALALQPVKRHMVKKGHTDIVMSVDQQSGVLERIKPRKVETIIEEDPLLEKPAAIEAKKPAITNGNAGSRRDSFWYIHKSRNSASCGKLTNDEVYMRGAPCILYYLCRYLIALLHEFFMRAFDLLLQRELF